MTVSARPDAEHDAVVACRERHQVVVAPPGTGKTYVSVRLAAALAVGLAPHARVLLLTFSRQARAQLEREAGRQLAPALRARIEVTNYHRLCWQAVQAYRRVLGLPDELDVGSSRRRATALKAASAQGWNAIKDHSGLADSLAEHAFEAFRDRRTPPPDLLQELLVAIDVEQRQGRLVFDDLGALFWRLLETQPTVARAYAARYPAVIADEHQDASALQDALVRRFGVVRLVVLADHMQLIHGFPAPTSTACAATGANATPATNSRRRTAGTDAPRKARGSSPSETACGISRQQRRDRRACGSSTTHTSTR